jgi:hypothetical protein
MDSGRRPKSDAPDRRVCVSCPACGQGYRVASRLLGRRLVCRHCRKEWRCSEVELEALRRAPQAAAPETPSDSTQTILPEDLPPMAGSSSTVIDTHWAGRKLGRYKVLSVLGQGGMGVVWRGHDETLRRDVALKILNRRRRAKSGACLNTELFMQEARAVAKLQHPHVVAIYEVAQADGQVFLALELMEGGTLKEYVDRNGAIAPRELFSMMVGPSRALALAHKRGIIHRDIKPGNLMFDDHGHLKLMDFGLADVAEEAASERMKGKAVGSLGWVAPETVRGLGTTPSSDIYGMGLVMLFALLGKPWLQAGSRTELIALHQNPPELNLSGIKGLSPRAAAMLQKCLAVDPGQRYASADELADALQAISTHDPAADIERRRSHASIAVAAAAIGLLIGVSAVTFYFTRLTNQASELAMPVVQLQGQRAPEAKPPARGVQQASPSLNVAELAEAHVPWPEVPDLVDAKQLVYVAEVDGSVFHWATCMEARKILACDLKNFRKFDEAESAGLKPCPICKPQRVRKPDVIMGMGGDGYGGRGP